MPENHVFEYAVIRVVPRVEREEFLNVGVVLYCARKKFLQARIALDENRLRHFSPQTDIEELTENLAAFDRICHGLTGGGPISALDIASRFRWLTATRSTVIQSSKVHPGLSSDPLETLEKLFEQMVK